MSRWLADVAHGILGAGRMDGAGRIEADERMANESYGCVNATVRMQVG
jgi:hypothetical protein